MIRNIPYPVVMILLLLSSAGVFWWELYSFSPLPMTAADAWHILSGQPAASVSQTVIETIRLPRGLMAALIGASLAVAGVIMQALTNNPLASPALFGINAGAALAVALISTLFSAVTSVSVSAGAMSGGAIAWLVVMVLGEGFRSSAQPGRLVLAGLAVSAFCAAMTKACILLVEDQASGVLVWLAGSFASVSWTDVNRTALLLCPCLLLAMVISAKLNVLQLGEERAISLGVSLSRLRLFLSVLVLVLVGVSVSAVGALAFVGLVVPHIARMLVGYDHRKMLPVALTLGSLLALLADSVSRIVVYPTETPAGAVLAILGAPCFLYLARRRNR